MDCHSYILLENFLSHAAVWVDGPRCPTSLVVLAESLWGSDHDPVSIRSTCWRESSTMEVSALSSAGVWLGRSGLLMPAPTPGRGLCGSKRVQAHWCPCPCQPGRLPLYLKGVQMGLTGAGLSTGSIAGVGPNESSKMVMQESGFNWSFWCIKALD